MNKKLEKKRYLNLSDNNILYKENKNYIQTSISNINDENTFSRKTHSKFNRKYYYIPTFIIFLLIFFYFRTICLNNREQSKFNKNLKNQSGNPNIYFEENFPNLKNSFKNAKDFLDKCLRDILINDSKVIISQNPKVSAVVPFYNRKNTISRAIRSIQNQNMTDFEIILINDFSLDETMSIIENIQKDDPRIKVIRNKKVMGTLYSRSIGTLYAKGSYIFPLDSDDMLLDKDIYSSVTRIADKGNFDLVGFRIIFSLGSNILKGKIKEFDFSDHANNLVLFQPELGLYPIRPSKVFGYYDVFDVLLYNKCIKAKIYKAALNKMGEEKYSRYMTYHEDLVATCFLFNTAQSMKYIGKYGILHIRTPMSDSLRYFSNREINFYNLYLMDIAIDFTKDSFESRKLLVYIIIFILNRPELKESLEEKEFNKLFKSYLDKILDMKYIKNEDKEEIRKRAIKLNISKETMI